MLKGGLGQALMGRKVQGRGGLRPVNVSGSWPPQTKQRAFNSQDQEIVMPQPCPKPLTPIAFGLLAAMLATAPAMAEDDDDDTGRLEYMYSCSACHGESARGDGPVARYLNVATPSLTTLSQENEGEFPLYKVVQIIDGRSGIGAHGTIMPVWGARYMPHALAEGGHFRAEVIVRGRILSIAHYLESIQD